MVCFVKMLRTKETDAKNEPLSPRSICVVLKNLFRKESDGSPIDFYIRRLLIADDDDHANLLEMIKKNVEECGGHLWDAPHGNHSIELAFLDTYKSGPEYECSKYIFNVEYIDDCIQNRELLNIETYRIGDYNAAEVKDANLVMKGLRKWSEIIFSKEQHGVKHPDFGLPSTAPHANERGYSKKKARNEYSLDEDNEILKYLLRTNSYDKTGGNSVWRLMEKELRSHSYQSLQNRFRRHILPNINRYKNLSTAERNLFLRIPSAFNAQDAKESSKSSSTIDRLPPTSEVAISSLPTSPERQDLENPPDFHITSGPREKLPVSFDTETHAIDKSKSNIEKQRPKSVNIDLAQPESQTTQNSNQNANRHLASDNQLQSDRRILDYIAQNGKFGDVHGQKLWMDIQNIVFRESTQDWQAIKRRFFENIVSDLESGKHEIENDVLIQFHQHCQSWPTKEFKMPNDIGTDSSSTESLHFDEGISSTPTKQSEQQSSLGNKQSFGQRNYSFEEDKLILEYLIKTGRFNEVRGKSLWVEIENSVLKAYSRSWESAKNRYLRTISKNFPKYNLEKSIVRKLKAGLVAERNLGGPQRESSRTSQRLSRKPESDEDEPSKKRVEKRSINKQLKHPALNPENILQANRTKRKLYHQPLEPIAMAPLLSSTRISENSTKISGSQTPRSSCILSQKTGTSEPTSGEPSSKLSRLRNSKHLRTAGDTFHIFNISRSSLVLKKLTQNKIPKDCDQ